MLGQLELSQKERNEMLSLALGIPLGCLVLWGLEWTAKTYVQFRELRSIMLNHIKAQGVPHDKAKEVFNRMIEAAKREIKEVEEKEKAGE